MFAKLTSVLFLLSSQLLAQQPNTLAAETIHWPEAYEPSRSKFYVHNEISVQAPPEQVWQILIDAESWPEWYKRAKNVSLRNPETQVLQANSIFTWKTMGLHFESTIKEFSPNSRMSWESKKRIIQGYHAWLIIPTPTGCKVITDESQNGWLTFLEKTFQRRKLKRLHDVWLLKIKQKAEANNLKK